MLARSFVLPVAMSLACASSCKNEGVQNGRQGALQPISSRGVAAAAELPSAHGPPAGNAVPLWVGKAKLTGATEVQLCIRPTNPGDPFAVSPAPFDCSQRISAQKAPYGWSVSGSAIHAVITRLHPRHGEIFARQIDVKKDPSHDSLGGITLDDGEQSYFDTYVAETKTGGAVMFIDVEVD